MEIANVSTKDGWNLTGLYCKGNDSVSDVGAVLMHGWVTHYDENNRETFLFGKHIEAIAETLSRNGIPSLAAANRGYYRPEFFDDCASDIRGCIEFFASKGIRKIILLGHSLGGAKAAYFSGTQICPELKAVVLMSAIPAIHRLFAREDLLKLMRQKIANGKGDLIFSRKEGGAVSTFLPKTFMKNYESGYQKETLDAAENISVPILSIAAEKEWDWFREVLNAIKGRAKKSPRVDTKIFEGVAEHTYAGHEQEIADFIAEWVKKIS